VSSGAKYAIKRPITIVWVRKEMPSIQSIAREIPENRDQVLHGLELCNFAQAKIHLSYSAEEVLPVIQNHIEALRNFLDTKEGHSDIADFQLRVIELRDCLKSLVRIIDVQKPGINLLA